ncbi:MAG TPA: beta-propeller fold lactonase family protein [Ktedonobacterales bacterium]
MRWSRAGSLLTILCLLLAYALAGCSGATTHPSVSTAALPILPLPSQLAGYHIFVTDLATGDLSELGLHTWHVSQSIHGLGLSSDGRRLYVTDISGSNLIAYTLHGDKIGDRRATPVGSSPVHAVEALDGRTVYVTNFGGASISVIDTTTWTQKRTIAVPAAPHAIVLSPDGRLAYVSCYGGAAIAVLDTQQATLTATIALPAGSQPYGIALSRDGRYLYASDNLTGRLFVVDTQSRRVLPSVLVGNHPALIARSPDGTTLYVTNGGSHSVSVLDIGQDPARPRVRATIAVDGYPHGLAVTPDGRYLVVANTISRNISVVDTQSEHVIATIPGEKFPNDVIIPA